MTVVQPSSHISSQPLFHSGLGSHGLQPKDLGSDAVAAAKANDVDRQMMLLTMRGGAAGGGGDSTPEHVVLSFLTADKKAKGEEAGLKGKADNVIEDDDEDGEDDEDDEDDGKWGASWIDQVLGEVPIIP